MFVKIDDHRYVNTDKIEMICRDGEPNAAAAWYMRFARGFTYPLSEEAAALIFLLTEANESIITESELAAQPAPSLTSRVAVILRDQFVGGATQDQIGSVLNLSESETANELSKALAALIAETIVIAVIREDKDAPADHRPPIFYHATHAPAKYYTGICVGCHTPFRLRQFETQSWSTSCEGKDCWQWIVIPALTSNPDLSDAAATPANAPAECSGLTINLKTFD